LAEGARERDRRAEDGADGGRPRAVEERPCALVAAQAVEAGGTEEDERERGSEGDERCEEPAADSGGAVADGGDGVHDGPRRHLPERDGGDELARAQPVVPRDCV